MAATAARFERVILARLSRAKRLANSWLTNDTFEPMLRTYGPGCDGSIIDAKVKRIPKGATWIDLEEPTAEEEALVERCIHLNIPTRDEMAEIEPSSRLFERDNAFYMTISVLCGVVDGTPSTTPITSCPGTRGNCRPGHIPSTVSESL